MSLLEDILFASQEKYVKGDDEKRFVLRLEKRTVKKGDRFLLIVYDKVCMRNVLLIVTFKNRIRRRYEQELRRYLKDDLLIVDKIGIKDF